MTTYTEAQSTFRVNLGHQAHRQAEQFSQHHAGQKAEQIYCNTLSVYAVNFYLQCLGFETDLSASDSWDRVTQALSDVADLVVKYHGSLECRYILPGEKTVQVPPEVWGDRIGYLVVLLDESLDEAELLGFIAQVETPEVALEQVQCLDEFSSYLNQFNQTAPAQVPLSHWLAGVFTAGWQPLSDILGSRSAEPAFGFRNAADPGSTTAGINRCKRIELGQSDLAVVVLITLNAAADEIEIQIEVVPAAEQAFLPSSLQLTLLDEDNKAILDAQTTDNNQKVRLQFGGEVGDRFSVRITLGDISMTEAFVI